jgi:hypothetical protein
LNAGNRFSAHLDCTPKALWKLNWFLRDFGYDAELLERDEVEDRKLIGLQGIVSVRHSIVHGTSLPQVDAFAPRDQWEKFSPKSVGHERKRRKMA